jgi:hypothetical protein
MAAETTGGRDQSPPQSPQNGSAAEVSSLEFLEDAFIERGKTWSDLFVLHRSFSSIILNKLNDEIGFKY